MTKLRQSWVLFPALLLVGAMTPAPAQTTYQETVLHNFARTPALKGANPSAGVIRDEAGNI